jgi:magnesium-transporting ATPase (P-type)
MSNLKSPLLDSVINEAERNPVHHKHEPVDLSFNPEERGGLTTEQAEELTQKWGYNELPVVEMSLLYLFFLQFTGTMPYMLEVACIIAAACQDWPDVGIILAMLIANGCLGFREQLEAAHSLVRNQNGDG